jgi:hypothetical protein
MNLSSQSGTALRDPAEHKKSAFYPIFIHQVEDSVSILLDPAFVYMPAIELYDIGEAGDHIIVFHIDAKDII